MITFQYPGYNPVTTLTLKEPEIGDEKTNTDNIQIYVTVSGKFKTVTSKNFDNVISTTLEFVGICNTLKDEVENFFLSAQDGYIYYTDYNGTTWMCQLVDESLDVINNINTFDFAIEIVRWEHANNP